MADLRVENHGSLFMLFSLTEAGTLWVDEHIPEDAMRWGSCSMAGIVVEHRYIGDIVRGAINDGLSVV